MNRTMTLNRASSLGASDGDVNDGMAELELQRLQRQYRIMEGDRKAYSEESRLLIAKQRASIEKLKHENQYLLEELNLLEQRSQERYKKGMKSKRAESIAEEGESYNRKIRYLMTEVAELDNALAALDKEIEQQRSDLGGVNAASENSAAIQKQIRILENRLDKALVKFNKSLAVNKKLRGTIDNLRRERAVFDNIYRKFERELADQKKAMADIIEASNSAYEARDEAQARIIVLREKSEKEQQAYIQEVKELDRTLEQDRRLKEFMATKIADRHPDDYDGAEGGLAGKKEGKKKEKTSLKTRLSSQDALNDTVEAYEATFANIQKETGVSSIKELIKRMKTVEDENFSLFNYVNEVNNDIEQMAEEITDVQRKIDALRVQHAVEETEMTTVLRGLETQLTGCNEKHAKYESQYNEMVDTVSQLREGVQRIVSKFDTLLPSARKQTPPAGLSGDQTGEDTVLNKITEDEIAQRPFRDDTAVLADAADAPGPEANLDTPRRTIDVPSDVVIATGVTDNNLLQYLGMLEQKTNELLTMYYMVNQPRKAGPASAGVTASAVNLEENAGSGRDVSSASPSASAGLPPSSAGVAPSGSVPVGAYGGLLGHGPAPPVGTISIIPPNTGDDHDDDLISDDDDRPLTREELEKRTLRGLERRQKTAVGRDKPTGAKHKRKGAGRRD
ncbi:hypothetical protein BC832DRAFT_44214 [Gaertneriomyces semiglobifer]|nr:hypothetical protein BC832DRAFT_44214 [Gaertneriomyces semiglobifer]